MRSLALNMTQQRRLETLARAASVLLTAMRWAKRGRAATSGHAYLKEVRSARHGR